MVISMSSARPHTPTRALPPWTPLGDFCPQSPCFVPSETNFWLCPCRKQPGRGTGVTDSVTAVCLHVSHLGRRLDTPDSSIYLRISSRHIPTPSSFQDKDRPTYSGKECSDRQQERARQRLDMDKEPLPGPRRLDGPPALFFVFLNETCRTRLPRAKPFSAATADSASS